MTQHIPDENTALLDVESFNTLENRQSIPNGHYVENVQPRVISKIARTIYNSIKSNPLYNLLPSITLGCIIWFGVNPTDTLTLTSIRLLAVFTGCVFALITTSINISILVITALCLLSVTGSFQCKDRSGTSIECRLCDSECLDEPFQYALEGFSNPVVWLIFAAFHLGKAVEVTGLGKRVSLLLIRSFGKNTLGLAYAVLFSELILAPFVPSTTARGGGIVLPVVQSIATALGSTPNTNPRLGGFLMLVGSHANFLSASMYMTGMAPNPMIVAKANELYPHLNYNFTAWFKGSCVPALTCAILLPVLLSWSMGLSKPASSDIDFEDQNNINSAKPKMDDITEYAKKELKEMGLMSLKEWQLCCVFFMCLFLWIATDIDSTLVAFVGIVVLLYTNTIKWKDVADNKTAWETFFWLGGFITIATQLSLSGASTFLGERVSSAIIRFNLSAIPTLGIAYFLTTFLFSSLSAHTVAFAGTFLDAGRALGANPLILTSLLAYFGALGGCMTNFSTGTSAMYYAPGYIKRSKWFIVGGQITIFYLFVYFTVGMGWWKLLGWQ